MLLLWLDNIKEVRGKITTSYFPGERIITDHIIVLDNREITAHFWHIYKEVESHRFTPNSRGKFSDKRSIDVMRVSLVHAIAFFVDCWCLNAFSWPVSSLLLARHKVLVTQSSELRDKPKAGSTREWLFIYLLAPRCIIYPAYRATFTLPS